MSLRPQIALPGSLALACWARDMKQQVAYLKDLYHTCGWTLAFTAIRLRLCDQPLLGNSLATLAAGSYRTEETVPAGAAKFKKGGVGPLWTPGQNRKAEGLPSPLFRQGSNDHRMVNSLVPPPLSPFQDQSLSRRSKIEINKLPSQVGSPLLCRWAGETGLAKGNQGDHDLVTSDYGRQPAAGSGRKKALLAPLTRRADTLGASPLVIHQRLRAASLAHSGKRADFQIWQDSMVKRTAQAFLQNDLPAAMTTPEVESVLCRQWASQVGGPEAPAELLLQLTGLSVQERGAGLSNDARMTPSGNDGHRLGLSSALEKAHRPPLVKGPGPVPSLARNQELPMGQWRMASQVPLPSRSGTTDIDRRTLSEPPDLPPLVPPRSAGMPGLPVAAETAHQEAWSEAVTAEDGLEILAEKIKRILEEEARRHGIDV